MKLRLSNKRTAALTRVEVLVIAVTLVVLALVAWASLPWLREAAKRQNCFSRLRAEGFAIWLWAGDHNDKFPMEISTNDGGAREWMSGGNAFRCFQVMSNELNTPRILICPADNRQAATNFQGDFNEQRLSYFVGLDAQRKTNTSMFLFGDRNLTNNLGTKDGVLELTAKQSTGWTREMHNNRGNICLVDGSVQKLDAAQLRPALQATGVATNRLVMP